MIIWAWIDALFFWIMGIILLLHTIKWWNNPVKGNVRNSEIVESIIFFIIGYYILTMVSESSEISNILYLVHIISFSALIIFFWGFNVLPNYIKSKKNPEYRNENTYEKFLEKIDDKYNSVELGTKKDRFKDFSRKLLHFMQFIGIISFHFISESIVKNNSDWNVSFIEFRNFIYFLVAGFFWIMMMVGDMTRITHWEYLPRWGWRWFEKSLEPEKERWTVNGATTILLANMIWIHPVFPIQVLIITAWVSCIGDAVASIVGKYFGNHKMTIGNFPQKSFEGLIAGVLTTVIGTIGLLKLFPVLGLSNFILILIALVCGIIFALVDMFSKLICDNLLNGIFTGAVTWILILIFTTG
ncbi:phosphatidate cytidylyltransferase [Promethearchaeum syntrophicum]|uniref:Phosphatidate cytidylyltransferase n=1 Tax=Promethearchaeum syntrophicum TaxID=2594042 RepID=A0A5B9D873_9ARCH|nr:phosphatidate cytidylyltransferase [Candidatus Prometheoarchaeum syntrophicum]QEE15211.1 Cytidylyltransferase family protein [Candidatus Prometheoarchaeum syntrophicum]